ncbi:MAG: peptide chain release factor N(5)-glutamine methyltransferase [Defluviitaleaceae bacterium]|nr:peptide chain release factor N(5)-glutamine methyltransferase [Defluviitaleaceae bacterium]
MTNSRSLRNYLTYAANELRRLHIESANLDAQLLAAHVLRQNRVYVLTHPEIELTQEQARKFDSLIERRSRHEPIAYILGFCEFMSLTFAVDNNVLIPRADTETLVEAAISEVHGRGARRVLEIGTGSGCIAVSLAVNCPDIHITAVDISPPALDVAKDNAAAHGVNERVRLVHGDIFDNRLTSALAASGRFDMLLSNPPYITAAEMSGLPPSVRSYEPHTALLGGSDGLNFYREIARRSPSLLSARAAILLEIGCDQADQVRDIYGGKFTNIAILQDLAAKDRVLRADYVS